jgi:beta-glucanase (GH16 family)
VGSRAVDAIPGCALAWSDEFDGPAGSPPDPAVWQPQVGGHGWGNQELQYYTDGENASLDGHGSLAIEVRRSDPADARYGGREYTSARLTTKGRIEFQYGVAQARMRLPAGRGMWPAFWMLGRDRDEAGWPWCGEIDVMESFGVDPHTLQGAAHGPGYSGARCLAAPHRAWRKLSGDFHEFSVAWEPGRIRWYFDDVHYATVTPADLHDSRWVFDKPFFLLVNVAVGGVPSVPPDASVPFPQRMLVDYVRVYAPPRIRR